MQEAPKKVTRVSFVGVSNLPSQKANELAACLQRIVSVTAEAHNACEDARIDVDAKFTRLTSLTLLSDVVARVAVLAGEEATLGAPVLQAELKAQAQRISKHADVLLRAFAEYDDNHPKRMQLANGVFRGLLQIAQDTIELLRSADRGACEKLTTLVSGARVAAQQLCDADTVDTMQNTSRYLFENSNLIAKRFQRRAEVFEDPEFERKIAKAAKALELATSNLLASKQTNLLNGNTGPVSLEDISRVLSFFDELALNTPEFGVNLEVEYFDDNTGVALASLLDASRKGDMDAMVRFARELVANMESLLREGQHAALSLPLVEKEKVLQACEDANNSMLEVIQISKENAVNVDSPPITRYHLAQQQNAAARLRQAVQIIPSRAPLVLVKHKNTLANAARGLMDEFAALLGPLTPTTPPSPMFT